ncbi:uncharacterized protein V6R79_012138 [Siganus canaliculatus]
MMLLLGRGPGPGPGLVWSVFTGPGFGPGFGPCFFFVLLLVTGSRFLKTKLQTLCDLKEPAADAVAVATVLFLVTVRIVMQPDSRSCSGVFLSPWKRPRASEPDAVFTSAASGGRFPIVSEFVALRLRLLAC